ncbi:MAG TPA: AbrB/MazE/SpoVT family DNA-binding domain-containing protein [Terricaulis sp.]|nr:AbrB/MazE/SpoVT family DNA-binding domain-containing protein [Terricaulis sp.]
MSVIKSKITAQGQVSIPADIRKKLGVGPGGVIEWAEEDGKVVVRRPGKATWADVHKAAFPNGPPKGPPVNVKEAIAKRMRERYARD